MEETTLKHKTRSKKPETQPGSFSLDDSNQNKNEYFRNLKPNIKPKSAFPKLDPNKTYRWTDQGFQTREGHKIMSSKGYRNSKKK